MSPRRPYASELLIPALCFLVILPAPAAAQQLRVDPDAAWCDDDRDGDRDRERYCEVRSVTIPGQRSFEVNASPNGGVEVEGWDRSEISIEAKVSTHAEDVEEARQIAREIEVVVDDGRVHSDAPRVRGRRRGWSVSYRVRVPRNSDLKLRSVNGGIVLAGVHGDIELSTTNGGLVVRDVGGDVRGRSTNGGIMAVLSGSRWDGSGLDLETTNGGIDLRLPDGYSARLETGATNGGFELDFPVMVEGRLNPRKLTVDLGEGGPPIRAYTTNGGVRVRRT